ncbi:MAG: hypothetical protein COW24_00540 [Candidatus Kerfeldbacteria bacterium CG15_BIG_FIL_POST_REV_8_21_14_020_45_12]|uniref:Uncharacterized protein n=1 Tax=Candidatus Kerfeldbacteria bacterium CG15_BIG_FIL_POST_REV_8_21_14_020_45_12 TaxID=2014247 RepID=A0A2M7H594_9BACT|nr:MAG: hypothetical protein COW24_00540 [Candidatus Kerfeldbacteria bacterium CG15_BIG_FIL_POST_REV_8_21_14_020_45_12]PJA93949.1 MAG: hypothetical protein CO132_00705 [Candidatus Kerfeldbacteria bacterium CG_4_9_14_3_um_filter_45_8]
MSEAAELRIHMRTVWNDQIDDEGRNRKGVVPVSSLHGETIARFFSTRYGVNIEDYTKPPRDLKNVKASEFSEQKTRDLLEWIKIKREEQTSEVNFTRRQRK